MHIDTINSSPTQDVDQSPATGSASDAVHGTENPSPVSSPPPSDYSNNSATGATGGADPIHTEPTRHVDTSHADPIHAVNPTSHVADTHPGPVAHMNASPPADVTQADAEQPVMSFTFGTPHTTTKGCDGSACPAPNSTFGNDSYTTGGSPAVPAQYTAVHRHRLWMDAVSDLGPTRWAMLIQEALEATSRGRLAWKCGPPAGGLGVVLCWSLPPFWHATSLVGS
jgi:hypothetical protein